MWHNRRAALGVALVLGMLNPRLAAAQGTTFYACYVPQVGAIYLIKLAGLPSSCVSASHVPVGWTDSLRDGSITTGKLGDGAVTVPKLSFDPATQAELDGHAASADHDTRYFTKAELSTPGTLNLASNPVDWSKLKNVPAGFADEVDDAGSGSYTAGPGITISSNTISTDLHGDDGDIPNSGSNLVHWNRLTGVPSAFADGTDDGTAETDPTWSGSANTSADIGRTGRVGIGTLTPSEKLHVIGGTVEVQSEFDGGAQVRVRSFDGNENAVFAIRNDGVARVGGASLLSLRGNFGAEVVNPSNTAYRDITAASFTVASSRDFKHAISPVDRNSASRWLDAVIALQPVTYRLNDDMRASNRLGFIAEELPEQLQASDSKGVDLYALTTAAIAALQGLHSRTSDELSRHESRVAQLETTAAMQAEVINSLRRQLALLEAVVDQLRAAKTNGMQ